MFWHYIHTEKTGTYSTVIFSQKCISWIFMFTSISKIKTFAQKSNRFPV